MEISNNILRIKRPSKFDIKHVPRAQKNFQQKLKIFSCLQKWVPEAKKMKILKKIEKDIKIWI